MQQEKKPSNITTYKDKVSKDKIEVIMKRTYYKQAILYILLVSMFSSLSEDTLYGINLLKDVNATDWFYEDVTNLLNTGVINGYPDNTFKPNESINVAEYIKMILMVSDYPLVTPINDDIWYRKYVDTALANNLIAEGDYADYLRPITRGEMGKIIHQILKLQYANAQEYIPQVLDYASIKETQKTSMLNVFIAGIMTGYKDGTIRADANASRAEAATVIVRLKTESRRKPPELGVVSSQVESETSASPVPVTKAFSLSGIQIGSAKEEVTRRFGQPTEILGSSYGFDWYVYANDYANFKLIGIHVNRVVAFYSNTYFDSIYPIKIGTVDSTVSKVLSVTEFNHYYFASIDKMTIKLFSKKGLSDGVEGIIVMDELFVQSKTYRAQDQLDMEKVLFYLTNASRHSYGVPILSWSSQAKNSAYKHSKDMALNAYFSHTSINGDTFKTRMLDEGISASSFAENIGAGYKDAFEMHYALLHSDTHKTNTINPGYDHVGIGIYYSASSKYGYYVTQNYFKLR
jgi:hypothetical protein